MQDDLTAEQLERISRGDLTPEERQEFVKAMVGELRELNAAQRWAKVLSDQAAEIERLKERVERLEAFFSTSVEVTTAADSERRYVGEMPPLRVVEPPSLEMGVQTLNFLTGEEL